MQRYTFLEYRSQKTEDRIIFSFMLLELKKNVILQRESNGGLAHLVER